MVHFHVATTPAPGGMGTAVSCVSVRHTPHRGTPERPGRDGRPDFFGGLCVCATHTAPRNARAGGPIDEASRQDVRRGFRGFWQSPTARIPKRAPLVRADDNNLCGPAQTARTTPATARGPPIDNHQLVGDTQLVMVAHGRRDPRSLWRHRDFILLWSGQSVT